MVRRIYNLKIEKSSQVEQRSFSSFQSANFALPAKVDLRQGFPAVYDQGNLGSCTAQALVASFDYKDDSNFRGSTLFLYWNERKMDGTVNEDAGSTITTGIRALKEVGLCSDAKWPYVISKFTAEPTADCFAEAKEHQVIDFERVADNLPALKACLADGYPITFGFVVYEGLELPQTERTGDIPDPKAGEQMLGGHAIVLVGYDDATQRFILRNSWGTQWGNQGYGTISYSYVDNPNYSSDFWKIVKVEQLAPAPTPTPTPTPAPTPAPTPEPRTNICPWFNIFDLLLKKKRKD